METILIVKEEVTAEVSFVREVILRKYVLDDLDIKQLYNLLERFESLNYFLGRLEGEKYKGGN